jgi:tol-pal system protein YbgF
MKNLVSFLVLIFLGGLTTSTAGTKEEIVRLQSDVLQLQNQIRLLQKSVDEKEGTIISLLEQLNDKVAENSVAFDNVITAINAAKAETGSIEGTVVGLRDQIQLLGAKLDEVTNRMATLQRKLDENQMQVQALRSVPESGSPDVQPDRVYSATYNDYLMGNYSLAINGFQDFLANHPESEYADNAAYYLGDSYFRQGRHELAIQAFDQVINLYPKGDKASVAYFKKAVAQQELQQMDQAIETLQKVKKLFPDSPEANLAEAELRKLGLE